MAATVIVGLVVLRLPIISWPKLKDGTLRTLLLQNIPFLIWRSHSVSGSNLGIPASRVDSGSRRYGRITERWCMTYIESQREGHPDLD